MCEYCEGVMKPFPTYGRGRETGFELSLDYGGIALLEIPDIEFCGNSYEPPAVAFVFKHCPMCGSDLRGESK